MRMKEAYELVYNDLKDVSLFAGTFDSKNGNVNFMYGIDTVMKYIACQCGRQEEYENLFMTNFKKSLREEN